MSGLPNATKAANLGAVYTPDFLAEWLAFELATRLRGTTNPTIVDPACGDGALLQAMASHWSPRARVVGLDIDSAAVAAARARLGRRVRLIHADALAVDQKAPSGAVAWPSELRPDAFIANPPWGAELQHSASTLRNAGFSLARGQFDSADIFVELMLRVARPGCVLGLILPDSLFLPEHQPLRRLLAEQTQIELIARLGEGFFPNVYRGAVVLIVRALPPDSSHRVSCVRLTPEWRKDVLTGTRSLAQARMALSHEVEQRRFLVDANNRFDIDSREADDTLLRVIDRGEQTWTRFFEASRGVELSKNGAVLQCTSCGLARPYPRELVSDQCKRCGFPVALNSMRLAIVTRDVELAASLPDLYRPLIVGEDVQRYACSPSRVIKVGVEGINYKHSSIFERAKLLVRKTGIGIKASVDDTGAYTNQVVFSYALARNAPDFFLDYVLAVLCSRTMLAFYLKKHGELEWRSHPYVTQKVLASLPVTIPNEGTPDWARARAIAYAARQLRRSYSLQDDLRIEELVTAMYGLGDDCFEWIDRVLASAQALEPIRTMRIPREYRSLPQPALSVEA